MTHMAFERPLNASNVIPAPPLGLPPMGDAADRLIAAPNGRAAIVKLRQESEDAGHLLRPLLEDEDDARRERYILEARRKHLVTPKSAGGAGLDADDVSVVDVVRKIEVLDERLRRLATLIEDRRASSRNENADVVAIGRAGRRRHRQPR
jgi:hypothetical protein